MRKVVEKLVHREAVGELDRRPQHLFEPHRAPGFERKRHRVQHRRNRGAERPVARNQSLRGEQRGRRSPGRRPLSVDDDDVPRLRVVDHRRRFAAEAEVGDFADRRGEHRGDAGIHGVAPLLHHADPGGDGIVPSGGHDAIRAEDFRPERLDRRRRRVARHLSSHRDSADEGTHRHARFDEAAF